MVKTLAIDGPSGAGKGTISREIAEKLGWHYLDSGAIYRALAFCVEREQIDTADVRSIVGLAEKLPLSFNTGENRKVYISSQDVTLELYTEECGRLASKVAAIPEIRAALLQRQRDFLQPPGLVADGRDMGTVVFPHAEYKVYLTASLDARAERRYRQLMSSGGDVSLEKIRLDLSLRDERDKNRASAPLAIADGALEIDSSGLSIAEVITRVMAFIDLAE